MLTTTPPPEGHSVHLRGWLLVLTLLFAPWVASHAADEASMPPAQTVGEDVIGTPEPVESRYEYCSSGVLLPTKDNFYSVRDGLLSEYQIEPFKRIRSVALEWELLRDSGRQNCRIWATADHSKVILYNDKILLLLDAKTGKLLNSKPFSQGMTVYVAQIAGDRIFMLVDPDGFPLNTAGYQLLVWSLDSLEQQKAIELDTVVKTFRPDGNPPRMLVDGKRVYLSSGKQFLILSSKDLRLELSSLIVGNVWGSIWTSADHNEFYFRHSAVIRDHLSGEEIAMKVPDGKAALFYLETREVKYLPKLDDLSLRGKGYRSVAAGGPYSVNNEYFMVQGKIFKLKGDLMYRFYQYESGEAVMMKYALRHEDKSRLMDLSFTPGARKYMNMKIGDEVVVPINDATLKFYQSGSSGGFP